MNVVVFNAERSVASLHQHLVQCLTRGQQILMDDLGAGGLVNRVDGHPARLMQDQQFARWFQHAPQLLERGQFLPEMRKAVVANGRCKVFVREGERVHISLDQLRIGDTLACTRQHLSGEVNRRNPGTGIPVLDNRNDRTRAGADIEDRSAGLNQRVKRLEKLVQPHLSIYGLKSIPLEGKIFKERTQGVQANLNDPNRVNV